MIEGTTLREFSATNRIPDNYHLRITQLISKEVEQVVSQVKETARNEAKREAVGIIAEARRRAEDIVNSARKEADKIVTSAKNRAQMEVEQSARRQTMSEPPPNVIPPPFVDKDADRTHHGRMPVFWA